MTRLAAVVLRTVVSSGTRSYGPVDRIRTVLLHPVTGAPAVDEHVRVRLPAPRRWSRLGDVLIGHGTGASAAVEAATAHPGALVVAVYCGPRCWIRFGPNGGVIEFGARGPEQPAERWGTVASFAHSWLVAGLSAGGFGSSLCLRGSDSPLSSCPSLCRADSACVDADRPTEV